MNTEQLSVVCLFDGSVSFRKGAVPTSGKESAISAVIQACESLKAKIQQYTFDQMVKNNTEVLDALYNAEVLVIDISGWNEISVVLYHLGVRESVKSTVNIVLVCADEVDLVRSLPSFGEPNHLLPYVKDDEGNARYVNKSHLKLLNGEVANVKSKIMAGLPHLSTRLIECFKMAQKETRYHLTYQFVKELRQDRETLTDEELREKLCKMRRRLDDPRLLSSDSLLNMILSYMHVEAYSEMISLVEAIQGLQNYQHLLEPPIIRYYYAFALNRRNGKGDREKALEIITDVIASCKQPSPDFYGLEGRIYKDRFVESNCTDRESLEKAIESYRKGFQESSSDYLGINLATLLVIGGADRSNKELATVCNMLFINAGRKGSLQDLQDYWDVATFFEVSVLWADYAGAVKAARYMHKLNPPSWHLDTTLRNIRLILRARKIRSDSTDKDMELFNFWLEFFQECVQNPESKEEVSKSKPETDAESKAPETEGPLRILFPVLLVDMSGEEMRPAHLHLHAHSDRPNMRVCYIEGGQQAPPPRASNHRAVTPMVFTFNEEAGADGGEGCGGVSGSGDGGTAGGGEDVTPIPNFLLNQTYDLVFYEEDIKGLSLNPNDKRNLYFFTVQAEDYSIYFPCERSRTEFLASIRASLSEYENYLVDEHEDDEPIQFVYETDENGNPIVLGSGSFGTVYAGRELSREVKIAIKEIKNIPQKDLQPLIEEINLQSRLNHTNIVCYIGSVYENGVLKILMEHVPGGSLSFLLKKIGGLRDETVSHYSSQILEGLRYLHASKIVHRDIKGDNILVNMYRGELKIADFGASKRLGGLIRKAGTVTGTMRFMAPELINASKDGYGYPADIWSFGCTVVEMVTGKLPYHELDAFAAFYKAGYYSAHPDIPEELPEPCKAFIKRCFEIDPEKRASANELLTDPFILMYKRHKGRPQPKRGTSPRPPDSASPLNPGGNSLIQKLHSDSEKRRIPPFSALPYRTSFRKPSAGATGVHDRTLSTAPVLQGSQGDISPLKTLELPAYRGMDSQNLVVGTPPTGRRPEQCHSRERASFGGTSGASGEVFSLNGSAVALVDDSAIRSPLSDLTYGNSGLMTPNKVSITSPGTNSIQSPDNFNVIKSTNEAKRQLSEALVQFKSSVLSWWEKQTTTSARLPIPPPASPSINGGGGDSPKPHPSRERDEHDLIECMFDLLIDTLNGGESLQSLHGILKAAIRHATTPKPSSTYSNLQQHNNGSGRPPRLGSVGQRASNSFSFDEVQPACEVELTAVISRILLQQQQQQFSSESPSPVESAVHQVLAFIEKVWCAVSRSLPAPLKDGGLCQQKPHEMLNWIMIIGEIAGQALNQLTLQEHSAVLRRTKTISAGQRLRLDSVSALQLTPRVRSYVPPSQTPTSTSATDNWLHSTRRVQIVSPSASMGVGAASSSASSMGNLQDSPADSQPDSATVPSLSTSSPAVGLLERRTALKRNAYPLRYVKRAPPQQQQQMNHTYANGSDIGASQKWYLGSTAETAELSELQNINAQILEELKEVTRNYNQLLRSELERKEVYVAALEQLAKNSLALNDVLAPSILRMADSGQCYSGISTGFPSLTKWLSELGIPLRDIELIASQNFGESDFLEMITRDELWKLGITGGSVLRIWSAVCSLRRKFLEERNVGYPGETMLSNQV